MSESPIVPMDTHHRGKADRQELSVVVESCFAWKGREMLLFIEASGSSEGVRVQYPVGQNHSTANVSSTSLIICCCHVAFVLLYQHADMQRIPDRGWRCQAFVYVKESVMLAGGRALWAFSAAQTCRVDPIGPLNRCTLTRKTSVLNTHS